jgi:hypothetical protein
MKIIVFTDCFVSFTLSLIRILSFLGKVKESLFGQTEISMRESSKMIKSNKKNKFYFEEILGKNKKKKKNF